MGWPPSDEALVEVQHELGRAARLAVDADPWTPPSEAVFGGCFVAFAPGEAGPGRPGDRAWAAAVAWTPVPGGGRGRSADHHLRGAPGHERPRRADDVVGQAVVGDRVPASYVPGLLARREGSILGAAVAQLHPVPDVLLVDATGRDHPRGAGLAVHLGAGTGIPSIGVTHRPLVASGPEPGSRRGATSPVRLDGGVVGFWVCTSSGVRPVVAHAGWRTTAETAAAVVLAASSGAARTPVPLQEARRVAREARSLTLGVQP